MKLQNNVEDNGLLKSRRSLPKRPVVTGSLYQSIEESVQRRISDKGDWLVIEDGLSGKSISASEVLTFSKR